MKFIVRKDDRESIPDGSVANLTKQFSRQDSSGKSSLRAEKSKKAWNDESQKIVLFGWCFETSGNVNDMQGGNLKRLFKFVYGLYRQKN